MEIKTTEEIKKWNPIRAQTHAVELKFRNRRWVAVDDFLEEIEEVFSEGFFNYFHMTYCSENEQENENMIADISKKVNELKKRLTPSEPRKNADT